MEKEIIERAIKGETYVTKSAEKLGITARSLRYWLKKYGINFKKGRGLQDTKVCPACKVEKMATEFYVRNDRREKATYRYLSTYCKICHSERGRRLQTEMKPKAVEYKGGKCCVCGYSGYYGAFDFHHLSDDEKDFEISKRKNMKFNQSIKKELDKCAILCATCHREVHGGYHQDIMNKCKGDNL